ncbi:hypothetical protein [Streptomyces anulatus]|uniref:hypothetical protein n=1 Tax=Streptomyces anulatus TaxID=1892 RepID=UPI00386909BC|nr:hypothetical protein OG536_38375 [Streptomyces anulatus]
MIKNFVRGFGALSLALVHLLSAPAAQAAPAAEVTTLADAVGLVEVAEEDRTGYTRSKFKHWWVEGSPQELFRIRIFQCAHGGSEGRRRQGHRTRPVSQPRALLAGGWRRTEIPENRFLLQVPVPDQPRSTQDRFCSNSHIEGPLLAARLATECQNRIGERFSAWGRADISDYGMSAWRSGLRPG